MLADLSIINFILYKNVIAPREYGWFIFLLIYLKMQIHQIVSLKSSGFAIVVFILNVQIL